MGAWGRGQGEIIENLRQILHKGLHQGDLCYKRTALCNFDSLFVGHV